MHHDFRPNFAPGLGENEGTPPRARPIPAVRGTIVMETKKRFDMGHVKTWLSVNAIVIAVAIILLLLFGAFLRLELHPLELGAAVFAAILASVAAFAVAVLGVLVALRRLDVTVRGILGEVAGAREHAEADLAGTRERAESSIRAAQDAVQSKTDSAALFERLRFTQMLLDGRDVREPAEWLDNLFLNNGGDIRKIRDELKRDLVFGNIDATRNALAIYNAIAAIAEYYYSNLVVPEVILSRMAVRAQLAGFYFGPAFSALGMINRTTSHNVQRFLNDTKAYTQKNEPWLEQLVPEFYQEAEAQKGAGFPAPSSSETIDKVSQFKQSIGGSG